MLFCHSENYSAEPPIRYFQRTEASGNYNVPWEDIQEARKSLTGLYNIVFPFANIYSFNKTVCLSIITVSLIAWNAPLVCWTLMSSACMGHEKTMGPYKSVQFVLMS